MSSLLDLADDRLAASRLVLGLEWLVRRLLDSPDAVRVALHLTPAG